MRFAVLVALVASASAINMNAIVREDPPAAPLPETKVAGAPTSEKSANVTEGAPAASPEAKVPTPKEMAAVNAHAKAVAKAEDASAIDTNATKANKFAKCKYHKLGENDACTLEEGQLPCTKARTDANFAFQVVKTEGGWSCKW